MKLKVFKNFKFQFSDYVIIDCELEGLHSLEIKSTSKDVTLIEDRSTAVYIFHIAIKENSCMMWVFAL